MYKSSAAHLFSRSILAVALCVNGIGGVGSHRLSVCLGVVEARCHSRSWRTIDIMGRTMQVHARLGNYFFGFARKYAVQILNRLCPSNRFARRRWQSNYTIFQGLRPQAEKRQSPCLWMPRVIQKIQSTCSRYPAHQETTSPAIFHYRGIFVGLPPSQAGYLILVHVEDRIGSTKILV